MWTLSTINGTAAAFSLGTLFILIGVVLYFKHRDYISPRMGLSSVLLVSILAFLIPPFYGTHLYEKDLSGTAWQKFDEQKIETYVKQGKTVFVDVDAEWYLTCKANEILVLNTQEIKDFFKHEHSVEMVADWTNGDANITAFLHRFGKFGVPFYVVFGPKYPDGKVLPEVLTTRIVEDTINASHL